MLGERTEDEYAVEKPKEMYSLGGVLEKMPILGIHLPGVRTKVSRRLATTLIDGCCGRQSSASGSSTDESDDNNNDNNKGSMSIYINGVLEVIKSEIMYASRQGTHYACTQRAERMLRKAAVVAIKGSLRDAIEAWLERMSDDEKEEKEGTNDYTAGECLSTPAVGVVGTSVPAAGELSRRLLFSDADNNREAENVSLITPPVDLTGDLEADERDVDIVLTKIKEQAILQSLLHKRYIQKERVITLEHKNGRKLRVILPPESTTSSSFVEEARRTRWAQQLLHSHVQQKGMLLHLALRHPAAYVSVANQKKLQLQSPVLSTPQTLALGRLTGINGTQMSKLRSFLKTVGKVDLKCSKKEIGCIDTDVGLHVTMPAPTFSNCTIEWATTSGHEKKLPEQCHCWTADTLKEVASEVDLVLTTLFLQKLDNSSDFPALDYGAPGFDSPGIVVLFGGDHGAGRCPCHLKINFTSPQERKLRGDINWLCPSVLIASIDCSKDTFELLSNTVMPQIKRQMVELRNSCAVVVYSVNQPAKNRKAFLLPKNLQKDTLVIQEEQLLYRVGMVDRSINLRPFFRIDEDPTLAGSLLVKIVVSNFHDLHVGDCWFRTFNSESYVD